MALQRRIRPIHHLVMLVVETVIGTLAWNNRSSIVARFRKPTDEPPTEPPRSSPATEPPHLIVDIVNHTTPAEPSE